VQEVWDNLDVEHVINPLVNSFEKRIDLVIRLGGDSIQRWLHGSMERIGVNAYGPVAKPPPLLTTEQDARMMALVNRYGHKWKKIGTEMGIDPMIVKHNAKFFELQDMEIRMWKEATERIADMEHQVVIEAQPPTSNWTWRQNYRTPWMMFRSLAPKRSLRRLVRLSRHGEGRRDGRRRRSSI
jgi:hypothetical protein